MKVFLSPSAQEFNLYLTDGNEEFYMNKIADSAQQILLQSGIYVARNSPDEDFKGAIERSNSDSFDLHVAIHSNASPPNLQGKMKGPVIFYYPDSPKSICAAQITAEKFEAIYPEREKVALLPSYTLAELKRTTAPAVYIEVAYHDNKEDEAWIKQNVEVIAETIAASVKDYLNSDCPGGR